MSIFLAVKQIVDVLYQFRILDYGMVLLAMGFIIYGIIKNKLYQDFFHKLCPCDYFMAALGMLYLFSFLREPSAKSQFLKTESAFLIYFMGRIYAPSFVKVLQPDQNKKQQLAGRILTLVSYLIIYANFVYKLYVQITWKMKKIYVGRPEFNIHSDGALYYYKTDLAIGMIIAIIFVYVLGKNAVLKWITIVPVGIFMLFYETQAKAGQIILLLEYVLIVFAELYKRGVLRRIAGKMQKKSSAERKAETNCAEKINRGNEKNKAVSRVQVVSIVLIAGLTIFFVLIQLYPPMRMRLEDLGLGKEQMRMLERIFHSRHLIWWDAISYFVQQPLFTRLVGIDLVSETMHNSLGDRFHNLYFKQIYSIGYLGCYLYTAVLCVLMKTVCNPKNQKHALRFMTAAFWLMFLIMSISMEGLEYTQMSWYPFAFLGMLVTEENRTTG